MKNHETYENYLKIKKFGGGAYGKIYLCRQLKPTKRAKTFDFDDED